jgi:cardiolipin synthase
MDDLAIQEAEMVVGRRGEGTEFPASSDHPDHSHDIYTIANIITLVRLLLVPFFFMVLVSGRNDIVAFVLFSLAAWTDWLDGQIARRTGTVTEIGKAIDPIVDRLLIASGVLGLYLENRIPLWVVVLLLARDAYLLYGAAKLARNHLPPVRVIYIGKVTTALLLAGFSGLILNVPLVPGLGFDIGSWGPGFGSEPAAVWIWFVWAGTVTSMVTAAIYIKRGTAAMAAKRSAGG